MKLRPVIYLCTISLFILMGCSSQTRTVENSPESPFYTPKNWKTPIYKGVYSSHKKKTTHFKKAVIKNRGSSREQMDGYASWYGPGFHGKLTANGEKYNQNGMTAAHRILPMNTKVKVTNLENGRSTVVRINDRGPYAKNRILDVSKKVARLLGFLKQGTTHVRLDVVKYPKSYDSAKGLAPYKQLVIQVAVFNSKNRASDFKRHLAKRYRSIPFLVDRHSSRSYHIIAGPYNSKHEAVKVAQALRSDGVKNFVRSYRK